MNSKKFLQDDKILNFITGCEVKLTGDHRGRGVFTTREFKKGELIIVDKAIVSCANQEELTKRCLGISKLQGVEALRLGFLYDNNKATTKIIPPVDVYWKNHYK